LVVARVGGTLAAASILLAGAAFLAVPASLLLGGLYGDPGLVTAQSVLPHFGYILLVVGATIPAAVLMVASTRFADFPMWLRWVTVIAAILLVVTGPSVIAWSCSRSGWQRSRSSPDAQPRSRNLSDDEHSARCA